MPYMCPVCGYPNLPAPPQDYEICPSCGTEFEYHDALRSHAELRDVWMGAGAQWHSRVVARPLYWNGWLQLASAGYRIPTFVTDLRIQAVVRIGPSVRLVRNQGLIEDLLYA